MRKKSVVLVLGIALGALALLACDAGTFIALGNPTSTPTRTPRPTFTPRPTITPIPSDTATPSATDTPSAPTATATATRRVAATAAARPPTIKPAAPPPVAAPAFPVVLAGSFFCPQPESSPYWKITARFNPATSNKWLGGYVIGVFRADGQFLKAAEPSLEDDFTETLDGNCQVTSRYRSNAEIDVTEFRSQLPLIVKVIKSKADHTALSADFRADFPQPGNYYFQYNPR